MFVEVSAACLFKEHVGGDILDGGQDADYLEITNLKSSHIWKSFRTDSIWLDLC